MMTVRRGRSVIAVIVLAAFLTAGVGSALLSIDRLSYRLENLEPVQALVPALPGDPRQLAVAVRWDTDGYCSGQLSAVIDETPDRVVVRTVQNREPRFGDGGCAGLGSDDGLAYGTVELTAPLGERPVYRASDGALLPVSSY